MSNQEKDTFGNQEAFDQKSLDELRDKQQERLSETTEKRGEHTNEALEQQARSEALEQATATEKETAPSEGKEKSRSERQTPLLKAEKDASFNATMKEIRTHMSAPSRAFSSFIHHKAVEKTSEVVGATVARPNAILFGALFAFVFSLGVYLIANYNGYPLSGSETIASFALGWIVGIVFDYIRVLVFGKSK